MSRAIGNHWLHRFAMLTAAATILLICVGGVVTSKGVGMAVPDWPTTFGYNMFFFPFSKWLGPRFGGVFYEHSHRLVASGVGLLTVVLALWLWLKEERRWVRWLGVAALFAVILQGVLGGLRVTQIKDEIGIFHAALAQLFFVLVSAIALFTSRWWVRMEKTSQSDKEIRLLTSAATRATRSLRSLYWLGTVLIFVQLVLGATMRHQHAGLAIPDFPLAYHRLWPATDPASIALYNQQRLEITAMNPITGAQVILQMVHRITAILILVAVFWAALSTKSRLGWNSPLSRISWAWLALIGAQALLGAATIWTNKSADIATAHVAVGALSLMTGAMMLLCSARSSQRVPAFGDADIRLPQEGPIVRVPPQSSQTPA